MCFMKTPKIEAPEPPPQPDEPEQAARRQAELARALPGRDTLRVTGPVAVGLMRHHDRVPRRVPYPRLEPERVEVFLQPAGRRAAMTRIGRIGRDRRNFQPGEQALERVVEVGVDVVQDLVEVGHGSVHRRRKKLDPSPLRRPQQG